MYRITKSELRVLQDIADELRRMGDSQDQIGMPAAFYLKQLDKALPELAARIRELITTIEGQPDAG